MFYVGVDPASFQRRFVDDPSALYFTGNSAWLFA